MFPESVLAGGGCCPHTKGQAWSLALGAGLPPLLFRVKAVLQHTGCRRCETVVEPVPAALSGSAGSARGLLAPTSSDP